MPTWSIGSLASDDETPIEMVRIVADRPDSRIVGVIDTGDNVGFWMACDDIANQARYGEVPTPYSIAAAIAGRGATLHKVGRGGKLTPAPADVTCEGMLPD